MISYYPCNVCEICNNHSPFKFMMYFQVFSPFFLVIFAAFIRVISLFKQLNFGFAEFFYYILISISLLSCYLYYLILCSLNLIASILLILSGRCLVIDFSVIVSFLIYLFKFRSFSINTGFVFKPNV